MTRRTYTDAEKTAALAIVAESGIAHAHNQTKIPKGTLSKWASAAGIETVDAAKTAKAREVATASVTIEARRLALASGLLDDIETLRGQLFTECTTKQVVNVGIGKGCTKPVVVEVENSQPTFAEKARIMVSVGIAIDKVQLLTGQATHRIETTDPRERAVGAVDELAAKRANRTAA